MAARFRLLPHFYGYKKTFRCASRRAIYRRFTGAARSAPRRDALGHSVMTGRRRIIFFASLFRFRRRRRHLLYQGR